MTEARKNMDEEVKIGEIIDDRMREEEAESLCRWAAARDCSSTSFGNHEPGG